MPLSDHERREMIKGKTVLIVGVGSSSKVGFVLRCIELQVQCIVVDLPTSPGKDLPVKHFLPVDTTAEDAAQVIADELKKLNLSIDGVFCFWEDNLLLTAQIADIMGLKYNSAESTKICRSKKRTREAMQLAGLPTPVSILVKTMQDLEDAIPLVPFPAVVKPVFGASAQGASKVLNAQEARDAFKRNMEMLTAEFDSIYSQGNDCILEQYIDGDEVDVDVLIQDGELKFWSITDNLPTLEPSFVNTGSNLPSVLPMEKQKELVNLAFLSATEACGIHMGACHIEMKYTTNSGPQLIEVNGRMGGMPFPTWLKAVWGIDFVEQSLFIALDIPIDPIKPEPLTNLAGTYILSNCDGIIQQKEVDLISNLTKDPRIFQVYMDFEPGSKMFKHGTREQAGYITAKGKSMKEAVSIYLELCNPIKFPLPEYLWIAGAELLPTLSESSEKERHRRQSTIHLDQQRRASLMDEVVRRRRASTIHSQLSIDDDEEPHYVGRYLLPGKDPHAMLSSSPLSSTIFPEMKR